MFPLCDNNSITSPRIKRLYKSLQMLFRRATGDPPSDLAPAPGTLAPPFRRGVAFSLLSDKYKPGPHGLQAPGQNIF